jgi:DNA-binding GntR family transcriptional regulator
VSDAAPITRVSLREQVADALRAAVITGELEPGRVYSVPGIATRFAVSATPVREALLDLAKEGLVAAMPNKGYRVVELSEADLDEVMHLRLLLEVPAVREAAQRITLDRVAALRPLAREIEDAYAQGDLIRHLEADRRFHLEVLAVAGNARLVELVGQLRALSRLFGLRATSGTGEPSSSVREHTALLDLLEAGRADDAAELMTRHIGHTRGEWAGLRTGRG